MKKISEKRFNGGFALLSITCLVGVFNNFYYGWVFLLLSAAFMTAQFYVIYRGRNSGDS